MFFSKFRISFFQVFGCYSSAPRIPPDPIAEHVHGALDKRYKLSRVVGVCCSGYSTSFIFCVKVVLAVMLLRGLGASGDVLRATWSGLGLSWMPLGASGEALGGLLGCSWGLLGGSWRPLGAILGPLGAVLGPLGAVLWVMLPQVNFQKKSESILEQF